ncbi:gamma-glutamylcyclotransferase family protein [endosymbiont of Lamellibrachia barhami]|uniref:gamma-glutamylcyclotransferase family protein n=1 Tax=endosymbiont of Lamellibrachia barhami TaxID=205975 RepID=UPI0015AF4063|nr:gamma-glutamylcyclotransferase family protein [endosymbiont of Lamellibrachia barhami]
MPIVFQYGSNTSATRLNSTTRLNGDATVIGSAFTQDKYELDFNVWSSTNQCAAADIVPDGSTQIWGVLYEIPEGLIYRHLSGKRRSLDAIEGEGGNYQRTYIQVITSTNESNLLNAITYVVRKKKQKLKTSLAYASEIINGLKSHNVPRSYLEYVNTRILLNSPELEGFLPSFT